MRDEVLEQAWCSANRGPLVSGYQSRLLWPNVNHPSGLLLVTRSPTVRSSAAMTSPFLLAFDVEADGPCPGSDLYSMVSLGLVSVRTPEVSFYRTVRPISERWVPEALAVSGFTREQTLAFEPAEAVVEALVAWARSLPGGRPVLVSDNPAFDWQWINHYCHRFAGQNPFGFSARRLGDLHAGWRGNAADTQGWKQWRKTRHSHNALEDARGVAEGWRALEERMKRPTRPPR